MSTLSGSDCNWGDEKNQHSSQNCLKAKKDSKVDFNNNSRLGFDSCYQSTDENQSQFPGSYQLSNFHSCDCGAPEITKLASSQPDIYFKDGYGSSGFEGCKIDNDSLMKNGTILTNMRCKNQLFTRPYLTVPFMGRGVGDSCVEGNLIAGEDTSSAKPCNTLAEVNNEQFHFSPLVSCLKDEVQNPQHIIPEIAKEGWIRGGMPSRQLVKNMDQDYYCPNGNK